MSPDLQSPSATTAETAPELCPSTRRELLISSGAGVAAAALAVSMANANHPR
jgi:hypothetical protein